MQQEKINAFRKTARVSFLVGGALVLLTLLAFLATAIYETIVHRLTCIFPGC
jgi:hypothetical protein